jgi:hypothetical protein
MLLYGFVYLFCILYAFVLFYIFVFYFVCFCIVLYVFYFICFFIVLYICFLFILLCILFLLFHKTVSYLYTSLPTTVTNGNPTAVNEYHIISHRLGGQLLLFSGVLMKNKEGMFSVRYEIFVQGNH